MSGGLKSVTQPSGVDVKRMFNEIAPRYDLLNHLLSFGSDVYWRRRAVKELRLRPGSSLLDIAVGTGDLAFAALNAGSASVVGIDPAEEMLKCCRRKSMNLEVAGALHLICGVVEALPLKNESFDGAMVAFGVRNFADVQKGLGEIHRVLRGGAPFVALELTEPGFPLVRSVFSLYFHYVVPVLGRLISGSKYAYTYLPHSVSEFPANEAFAELLKAAGFRNVLFRPLTFGTCTLYYSTK